MSLYRPVHWISTDSFINSLYWTARSWLWNNPVTPDYGIWNQGDACDQEKWFTELVRILRIWKFLEPYFAECQYTLYVQRDSADVFAPLCPASKLIDPEQSLYPYAQYLYKGNKELEISPGPARVWAARDEKGRDVVIKAISGAVTKNELKVLRLLQSEPLCNDPRNHTIPVIDFIEFNQQTFVIMPRWCVADDCDFVVVGEVVRYAQTIFETVTFLHENNMTHGDLLPQNICMDVVLPEMGYGDYYKGYHGPERRYALIDFEAAKIHTGSGPYSPEFEKSRGRDIYLLADTLETYLRCIEDVIPEVSNLLDSMLEDDSSVTASGALSRFEEICCRLSAEDLRLPVAAWRWRSGKLEYRQGPPVNQQP